MERHTDERTDEPGAGAALKRRGILAAAGAAVAGLVARQTAQPVAAATSANAFISTGAGAFNGDFDAQGSATYGFRAIDGTFTYGVSATGSSFGVQGSTSSGTGVSGNSTSGIAVFGITSSGTMASVEGRNLTGGGPGVLGSVYNTNNLANSVAVHGLNQSTGTGGVGVLGQCDVTTGTGVRGSSVSGVGVQGLGGSHGVSGQTFGTGLVAGVFGTSATAYGVLGNSTAPFYSGLTAITNTTNCAALAATSTNAGAFAAYFKGFTYVEGNFAVSGNKSAAVMHPDGTRRLLYCVESPEAWFEDFGEAKLVGGRADVRLDLDFAALVTTDTYHVFPVSHDPANAGLSVSARRTDGFTVQEQHGGTSSGTFSWRVVAKRKDSTGKRLEKLTVPKFNLPDPDKLPKPVPPKQP